MKIFFGLIIILIGYAYYIEMHNSLFFLVGLAIGGWLIWLPINARRKDSSKREEWLELADGCKYQHYYKLTGIGVNTSTGQLYLLDGEKFKKYDFTDVRNFSYNLATGGTTIGGKSVAAGAHNLRQVRENEARSGFFVQVKDIDHPEWRVAFPHSENNNKKTEIELKRWMEIFEQTINS